MRVLSERTPPIHYAQVAITGAGGRTGGLVVKKLLEAGADKYSAVPIVRSAGSAAKVEGDNGLPAGAARVLDIAAGDVSVAATALQGELCAAPVSPHPASLAPARAAIAGRR